eukprot:1160565-Pelagomonas_calceolata.AAC.2
MRALRKGPLTSCWSFVRMRACSSTLDEGLLIISEQAISQLGAFGLHIACCSEKAEEAGVDGPHLMSRKKPRPFGQGPEN